MADSLRRLVNIGTFNVLQEKLERWLDNYYINTCDQNVARGCEIIELNAKVQGQLFKLLSVCAQEGGIYGGANVIKSRLLPFLGQNFFTAGASVDTSLNVIAEAAAKTREVDDMQDMYEGSLKELEEDLRVKERENMDLRDELAETKDKVDRSSRSASTDKLFLENENRELRRKLTAAEEELRSLRAKAGILSDYETQVRRLREDISLLTGRRDALMRTAPSVKDDLPSYSRASTSSQFRSEDPPAPLGLADAQDEIVRLRAKSNLVDDLERQIRQQKSELFIATNKASYLERDTLDSLSSYRSSVPRLGSPLSYDDPFQRARESNLIARWNDCFSTYRLDAMDTLKAYSSDHENNQRIIFEAVRESYSQAKLSFRQFKNKVRSNLAITYSGPLTLEEAVQDYVNKNIDLYDAPGMVSDVIRNLNCNAQIYLPPDTSFAVIQPFIRECVKIAWQMSALAHPLDIAVASRAELFDDTKYRRSYDSEYTAPLVNHHIWPSLQQGAVVRIKGECCTRRGASLHNVQQEKRLDKLREMLQQRCTGLKRDKRDKQPAPEKLEAEKELEKELAADNDLMSRRSRSPMRSRSVSPGPRSRSRSRSVSPSRRSRSPSPHRPAVY